MKHLFTFLEKINISDDTDYNIILKNIKNTIQCKEKYKNCYFWSISNNKSTRKNKEDLFHKNYPDYTFIYKNIKYEVVHNYEEKSSYIEFSLDITKNDKKTNITTLKTIYNKIGSLISTIDEFNL